MQEYEICFLNYEEAREAQKKTGGTIHTFLSTGKNLETITVYAVRYKQLF